MDGWQVFNIDPGASLIFATKIRAKIVTNCFITVSCDLLRSG